MIKIATKMNCEDNILKLENLTAEFVDPTQDLKLLFRKYFFSERY